MIIKFFLKLSRKIKIKSIEIIIISNNFINNIIINNNFQLQNKIKFHIET